MNHTVKMIYLVLLLILNYSCVEQPSTKVTISAATSASALKLDTLKFSSGIGAIFQDSKGNHWIGSLQEGVAVYNGNSFTYFTNEDGLTDNQIHSIQEDKQGVIWFNTQKGVCSYDGTTIKNYTKAATEPSPSTFPFQPNEPLQGKWMKSDNDLWFEAGNKEGVYRFDGQVLHYLPFPPDKVLNPNDNLFAVTDISKGKNNIIWFGTYAGVFGYNGRDFTIINDETLGFDRKIEPLHIRSILEDSKGRLWIGNNGIGVLLKEGDSILNFSKKHHLIHPNSSKKGDTSPPGTLEHIFTIAEDHQGNIWFGDRDAGVWKYDGEILKNYTQKDGLSNDFAGTIYEDCNKKLWFGMADGSIYTFNGKTFVKQF